MISLVRRGRFRTVPQARRLWANQIETIFATFTKDKTITRANQIMKASETSLRNLLEGTKQFQIPLFQRPYSWDKQKWETLWEDLMSLYDKEQEPHFLGSIVTQSIPGTAEGISPYVVIDGQQRLTTLAIIIAALRNYLQEKNHTELAEELYEYYLINKFKKDDDFYKILPTQDDREAYKSIIKNQNSREFDNKTIYKLYKLN